MSSAPIKDRIREHYTLLLDAFSNLLRSARLPDESGEAGARQGRVPGELMEVFAEKMLAACQALLGVVSELRRNALLNDVAGRNAEVASSGAAAEAEAAQLRQQFEVLQQQIDAALQLVPSLERQKEPPGGRAAAGTQQRQEMQRQQTEQREQQHVPMEA